MTDRKADADLHYSQALQALTQWHKLFTSIRDGSPVEAGYRLQLAQVSATRELTEQVRRIADALERRDGKGILKMFDLVAWDEPNHHQQCAELTERGWKHRGPGLYNYSGLTRTYHILERPSGVSNDEVQDRPRNVPKDAEGGGEDG